MDCTGPKNVLVIDFTGSLLGAANTTISRNEFIAPGLSSICSQVDTWNGMEC